MSRAEALHRQSERLRLAADRTKAAFESREKEAESAALQSQLLVQGLRGLEHAAQQLDEEVTQRSASTGR